MSKRRIVVLAQAGAELRALRLQPGQRDLVALEPCANLADDADAALRGLRAACAGNDLVLALKTSAALVKVVSLPAAARDALASAAESHMDRLSPFGSGEQTIGHEVLAEENGQLAVLVAGAPAALFQVWDGILPRLRAELPVRVDLAILGAWRQLRERHRDILDAPGGRKLALVEMDGEWNLVLAEAGVPRYIRGIAPTTETDWLRDLRLSLLSAEAELGPGRVDGAVVFSNGAGGPSDALLAAFCEHGVRRVTFDAASGAMEGCARRSLEKKTLNLLPAAWAAGRKARTASRNFTLGVTAAAALWILLTAALFGGPRATRVFTDMYKDKIAEYDSQYQIVNNFRQRVLLIGRYKDRSKSALDSLLVIVNAMPPDGVTLTGLTYQSADGVKIDGESTAGRDPIYAFKDALQKTPPFVECDFVGAITTLAGGRDRFSLEARFVKKEDSK